MHSHNTRYQAKLQAKRQAERQERERAAAEEAWLSENMWCFVNVPTRNSYAYKKKDLRAVKKQISEILDNTEEGDMTKLMECVDKHPYVLVVDQATRIAVRRVIRDYTPQFAEYGHLLIALHKSDETQQEVIKELAEWVLLKTMMESADAICKASICKKA